MLIEKITKVTVARTNLYGRQRRRFEVRIATSADLDDNEISIITEIASAALGVDPSLVAVVVPSAVDVTVVRGLVERAASRLRDELQERPDSGKPDGGGEIAVTMQHESRWDETSE